MLQNLTDHTQFKDYTEAGDDIWRLNPLFMPRQEGFDTLYLNVQSMNI